MSTDAEAIYAELCHRTKNEILLIRMATVAIKNSPKDLALVEKKLALIEKAVQEISVHLNHAYEAAVALKNPEES